MLMESNIKNSKSSLKVDQSYVWEANRSSAWKDCIIDQVPYKILVLVWKVLHEANSYTQHNQTTK